MIQAAKRRPLCVFCMFFMLLILFAKISGLPVFGEPPDVPLLAACIEEGSSVQITGRIEDRSEKEKSTLYTISDACLRSETTIIPLHTISMISTKEKQLSAGSLVRVTGILSLPEQATNPGQFDFRDYYASQRIYYSLYAESCEVLEEKIGLKEQFLRVRNRLADQAAAMLEPASAEILSAMILGDRSGLTEDSKRNYQVGGILHILAISGMHISLLGQGLFRILLLLGLPLPVAALVSGGLLVFYCVFTGGAPSAVRAVCMFAVWLGAKLLLRSYDSLCALALAGILMLIENPAVLFSSGFQLSFGAILAVSYVWPAVSWILPPQVRKPGKAKRASGGGPEVRRELLRKSVRNWGRYYYRLFQRYSLFWFTINLAMLPLTVWYYYEIPIWGLLPNLLLVPAAPVLLVSGFCGILIGMIWPAAGFVLLLPAVGILTVIQRLTEWIRSLPLATLVCGKPAIWQFLVAEIVILAGSGVLLMKRTKLLPAGRGRRQRQQIHTCRKIAVLLSLLSLFFLLFRFEPAWSLTMLDVGQGDCLILKNRQTAFLVDGGSSSVKEVGKYRILPYLKSQGISRLDGIFLTHPDEDHSNGLLEVLQAVEDRTVTLQIDCLYLPVWMKGTDEEVEFVKKAMRIGTEVCYLARGDRIRAGITEMDVLNPFRKGGISAGNSGSLVLAVHNGSFDALLTGDLESDGEKLLLPLSSYEYLKTAHHGSRGSSSEAFLQAVSPKVAAISAPKKSSYGHPHQETLDRLEAVGADIYVTREYGAICASGNGKSWTITGFPVQKRRQ